MLSEVLTKRSPRKISISDISQTEGRELPTFTEVQGASGYHERLCEFVQSQGITWNEDIGLVDVGRLERAGVGLYGETFVLLSLVGPPRVAVKNGTRAAPVWGSRNRQPALDVRAFERRRCTVSWSQKRRRIRKAGIAASASRLYLAASFFVIARTQSITGLRSDGYRHRRCGNALPNACHRNRNHPRDRAAGLPEVAA